MLGKFLKKNLNKPLDALASVFVFATVSPKTVCLVSLALAVGAFLSIAAQQIFFALPFFVLSVITRLAAHKTEKTGEERIFGSYLADMAAKYSEAMVFLALAFFYPLAAFLALAFSMISEYAKARLSLVVYHYERKWPSIGEQADRMLLVAVALSLPFFLPLVFGFETAELILYIVAFVAFIGSVQKFFFAKGIIQEAIKKNTVLPYARN